MQLCSNVDLGIQKLFQPGSLHLLYFKEFYSKPVFQHPLDFCSENGNGSGLFRNIQMHRCTERRSPHLTLRWLTILQPPIPRLYTIPIQAWSPAKVAGNSTLYRRCCLDFVIEVLEYRSASYEASQFSRIFAIAAGKTNC